MELPKLYIEKMKELLQEEFQAYVTSFNGSGYRGIRFNRRKVKENEYLDIYANICNQTETEKVPWTENGFYCPEDLQVSLHPFYGAGLFYIQEPSAMSPAAYLQVEETDMVLDLCAAPGGKATELASRAGFLLANDISASRAQALLKNLELSGNDNFAVSAENPEHLAQSYYEYFDKILVDAPCSGEGMFRKEPSLIKSWEERGPEYYHELQLEILESAYKLLKPGGKLLYSTCTFAVLEDEDTIIDFLSNHEDMHLVDIPNAYEGFVKGYKGIDKARRLFPHKIKGEGHFLALLEKDNKTEIREPDVQKNIRVERIKDRLYLIKNNFKVQKGIRFLRTGLYLGEYKKDKFQPSTVYALSITRDRILSCGNRLVDEVSKELVIESYVLKLKLEDKRVLAYLKGNTLELDTSDDEERNLMQEKGNCIICVEGFPLGYGRLLNGRIKNDYPQGYIWH